MNAASPAVALVVAAVVTRWLARPSARLRVLDRPGERSLHERPTPRTGGLGVIAGVVAGSAGLAGAGPFGGHAVWIGALVLAAVSFLDDVRDLPPAPRLLVHLGVAIAVAASGLAPATLVGPGFDIAWPRAVAFVVAVGYVLWMINLYNFMDGMDGLAGGMAVIGFGTLAIVTSATPALAAAAAVVAAAAAGFLASNFPPARIFLGDVGSCTLGYCAAVLTLAADRAGEVPLWISLIVFAPFVADATVTVVARALRGERVWEAHRQHHYQRLVRSGWSHRRTALAAYAVMGMCAGAAVLALESTDSRVEIAVAAAVVVGLAVLSAWVRRIAPREG